MPVRVLDALESKIQAPNFFRDDPWITIPNHKEYPRSVEGDQDLLNRFHRQGIVCSKSPPKVGESLHREVKIFRTWGAGLSIPPRRELKHLCLPGEMGIEAFRKAARPYIVGDPNTRVYLQRFDKDGNYIANSSRPFLPADSIDEIGREVRHPSYVTYTMQFDTQELSLLNAKEKQISPRFKIRVRTYAWDGLGPIPPVFIEIKRRDENGNVVKSRTQLSRRDWNNLAPVLLRLSQIQSHPYPQSSLDQIFQLKFKDLKKSVSMLDEERKIIPRFASALEAYNFYTFLGLVQKLSLRPTIIIGYQRESYLVTEFEGDKEAAISMHEQGLNPSNSRFYQRVTIDRNIMRLDVHEPATRMRDVLPREGVDKSPASQMYRFPNLAEQEGFFAKCSQNLSSPPALRTASPYAGLWKPIPVWWGTEGSDLKVAKDCYVIELKAGGETIPYWMAEIMSDRREISITPDASGKRSILKTKAVPAPIAIVEGYCKYASALVIPRYEQMSAIEATDQFGRLYSAEGKRCLSQWESYLPRDCITSERRLYAKYFPKNFYLRSLSGF